MVTRQIVIANTGTIDRDLPETLKDLVHFLTTPFGRAALIASLEIEENSEIRRTLWLERAGDIGQMFDRACERGELSKATDIDVAFSMAAGSVYCEIVIAGSHPDDAWIETVATSVLDMLRSYR